MTAVDFSLFGFHRYSLRFLHKTTYYELVNGQKLYQIEAYLKTNTVVKGCLVKAFAEFR